MQPHNLPMTVMGAGLLWFGWFGFNAGSALEANGLAVSAFTAPTPAPPPPRWAGCSPSG
jgi:Amt family ammonium transporter